MRRLCVISLLLLVASSAQAQSGENWLRRWLVEQSEASVTLARLRMEEVVRYEMEGAFGPHSMRLTSNVVVDRALNTTQRSVNDIEAGGRRRSPEGGRGRRFQSPVRTDLLEAADLLLFPTGVFQSQELSGRVGEERAGGRELVRLVTVASTEESAVERITWLFDRESGRLLRARAIIRGKERGTLVAEVSYIRIDGLDIAESRSVSGSFAVPRRTRTFTVLVEGSASYRLVALESLE